MARTGATRVLLCASVFLWATAALPQSSANANAQNSTSQTLALPSEDGNSGQFSQKSVDLPSFSPPVVLPPSSLPAKASASVSPQSSLSPLPSATVVSSIGLQNFKALSEPPAPTAVYQNPWAGNFSGPVPTSGTGIEYALQCQNAYFSFTSINHDYISASFGDLFDYTSVIRSTTVYEVHTYYTTSTYTLCDGVPRVITSSPTATQTTTLLPSTTVLPILALDIKKVLDPNCYIEFDDCKELWGRYYAASSAYGQASFPSDYTTASMGPGASYWVLNGETTTFPTPFPESISYNHESIVRSQPTVKGKYDYFWYTKAKPGEFQLAGFTVAAGRPATTVTNAVDMVQTPYIPHCKIESPTCKPEQKCTIDGDRVEILWFPPQTNVSRDMCATAPPKIGFDLTDRPPTNYTWTPITTGPYAVFSGETLYSGNVYVSLNKIGASCDFSGRPVAVGGHHGGRLLTMAPSELFSMRAEADTTETGEWSRHSGIWQWEPFAYSFNFNDLLPPYPWSAWNGQNSCIYKGCKPMVGPYNPQIAVPEAIRRLDPEWQRCDLALTGLYDPPIALTSVGNIFASLTAKDPVQQPTPGSSPLQEGTAEPTRVPPQPTVPLFPPDLNLPVDTPVFDPSRPVPSADLPSNTPINTPPENNAPGNTSPAESHPPNNTPPENNAPQDTPKPPNAPAQPSATPPPTPTTIGSVGDQPIIVNPTQQPGTIVIGTQTLAPGAPAITLSGTTVTVADPSHIIIGAPNNPAPSTINIPPPAQPAPTTIGTIGDAPIVVNPNSPSQVIVGGTRTLTPGAPGITVGAGTTISMADPSNIVVITAPGAVPSTIHVPAAPTVAPTAGAVITLPGGEQVTATAIPGPSGTSVLISGTLFTPGSTPVTLSNGVVLSNAPEGTGVVVINPASGVTSTVAFSSVSGLGGAAGSAGWPAATPQPTPGAVVTIGGREVTVIDHRGSVLIPELGITLTENGDAATVSGTVVSADGMGVVVGSTTVSFSTVMVDGEGTSSVAEAISEPQAISGETEVESSSTETETESTAQKTIKTAQLRVTSTSTDIATESEGGAVESTSAPSKGAAGRVAIGGGLWLALFAVVNL